MNPIRESGREVAWAICCFAMAVVVATVTGCASSPAQSGAAQKPDEVSILPVAADSPAASPDGSAGNRDYALPIIKLYEPDETKTCSFSLYDGEVANFTKGDYGCKNDQYAFFEIQGAHEGMEIQILNSGQCDPRYESYAAYRVAFRNGNAPIGTIAKTPVELSMNKTVGTPLNDGAGNPVLLAAGFKSGQLKGKVSCIYVTNLIPDGPFRFSRQMPAGNYCLNSQVDGGQAGYSSCNASKETQLFFVRRSRGQELFAAWIPRTTTFTPYLVWANDKNVYVMKSSGGVTAQGTFVYNPATQQIESSSAICAYRAGGGTTVRANYCFSTGESGKWMRDYARKDNAK